MYRRVHEGCGKGGCLFLLTRCCAFRDDMMDDSGSEEEAVPIKSPAKRKVCSLQ